MRVRRDRNQSSSFIMFGNADGSEGFRCAGRGRLCRVSVESKPCRPLLAFAAFHVLVVSQENSGWGHWVQEGCKPGTCDLCSRPCGLTWSCGPRLTSEEVGTCPLHPSRAHWAAWFLLLNLPAEDVPGLLSWEVSQEPRRDWPCSCPSFLPPGRCRAHWASE